MVDPIKTTNTAAPVATQEYEKCTTWVQVRKFVGEFDSNVPYLEETCHCPSDEPLDTELNSNFWTSSQGFGWKDAELICGRKLIENDSTNSYFCMPDSSNVLAQVCVPLSGPIKSLEQLTEALKQIELKKIENEKQEKQNEAMAIYLNYKL